MSIDNLKDCTELEYYSKSLLSNYKRFSMRYLMKNADIFDENDWDNISLFAPLNLVFILRFRDSLNVSALIENSSLTPDTIKFILDNTKDDNYPFCLLLTNNGCVYRKIVQKYSWK